MAIPKYLLASGDDATPEDICNYLNNATDQFHDNLNDVFETVIKLVGLKAPKQHNSNIVIKQQRININ